VKNLKITVNALQRAVGIGAISQYGEQLADGEVNLEQKEARYNGG